MKTSRLIRTVLSLFLLTTLASSCANGQTRAENKPPAATPQAAPALPADKDFTGTGIGPDFGDARNKAYGDVIRLAAVYVLGDNVYQQNQDSIHKNFENYIAARKYILGEMDKTSLEKEKKWVANTRDSDGNLILKLQAFVAIQKLSDDLKAGGLKTPATPASVPAPVTPAAPIISQNQPATNPVQPALDLSGVDISSLTFLVYYNPKDPAINNDPDQQTYAKWAVDNINKQLNDMSVQTFDLDAMDKLAGERNLLQEASSGNVGVGLLLAQKVYAELYAEVSPSITYTGNKANVILNIKVFVRTTGALIATIEKGGQQYESASLAASIKTSMREAAKKAGEELALSLKKYVANGRFYFVRLTGVNTYRDASLFSTAVAKVAGVVNITLKSGSKEDKTYDYNLQYKGNPNEVLDRLFEVLPNKPGFEKFDLKEIRGNELIFSLD